MLPFIIPALVGAAIGAGKTALNKDTRGSWQDYLINAGTGAVLGGMTGGVGGGAAAAGGAGEAVPTLGSAFGATTFPEMAGEGGGFLKGMVGAESPLSMGNDLNKTEVLKSLGKAVQGPLKNLLEKRQNPQQQPQMGGGFLPGVGMSGIANLSTNIYRPMVPQQQKDPWAAQMMMRRRM